MAGQALSLLVAAELARQALGPDALLLVDNVLRHEAPAPRAAPALVRGLLARPLDAADAAALFRRSFPHEVPQAQTSENQVTFDKLLESYIAEVQVARSTLPRVGWVPQGLPSAGQLRLVEAPYDASRFFEATLRFAQALRNVPLPRVTRFSSEIGLVVIGTPENDSHGPGAALIIDPGGNDSYVRAPATGGAVSVIVDLEGDDRYTGSDVAAGALSALVDFSGHDRYAMSGPGLAAAIGGAALLVDFAGNDRYEARELGQGAAAFGTAALIDLAGDDEYVLVAWGQGFGLAQGVGLLWDHGGDDTYAAAGVPDPYGRGRLSGAQGAGFGTRTMLGGGVGILRDGGGDDRYHAQMFAQGSGYYYGAGLLWDESGDDRYSALRYAQGNGAHQALGVLRDESGADSYALAYGVGQGMGLDLAVGALVDAAGDDRYAGGVLVQGTATANGLGLLHDAGGADALRAEGRFAWGEAEPLRGLPSVGLLLVGENASFEKVDSKVMEPPEAARCEKPDLQADRENFDALLAAGNALRCRLERGEMWAEAEALLARDPADPLAAWIAPALPAAPAPLREALREALWRHPSCGVRALSLSEKNLEEAIRSDCWRLQAAALRAGAKPGPEVRLPGFLR